MAVMGILRAVGGAVGGATKALGAVEGAAGAAESAAGAAKMGGSTGNVLKGALRTITSGNNTPAPSANESRTASAQQGASESGSNMFNTQTPF